MFGFPLLDFIFVLQKKINVVERIHEAILFIAVELETLRTPCGFVRNGLRRNVHRNERLGIGFYAFEELGQEFLNHNHRQHKVVQLVLLVDDGK